MALATYTGTLRPRVTVLADDPNRVTLEWVAPDGEVIWTEGVNLAVHRTFVSQIICQGDFATQPGHFIDANGKRHFVLSADVGRLGVAGQPIGGE